jgi:branched-chain amino acid transport system ATP-binding protein
MRLELDGISAGYGESVVLRDVSLVVPDGSVVALLGANGAGKTTLLSVVSGLLAPSAGSLLLDRVPVTSSSAQHRARAGVCHVTDNRAIFGSLTVRENLRLFSSDRAEAEGIDRAVGAFPRLGQRLGQVAGTMSGGEQQMLALARAYAQTPGLLLIDEVSMGLAPIIVDEIFEFIARAALETSILIVEQYIAKALAIADFAYVLSRGRIVHQGEAREVGASDLLAHYLGAEAL